MHTKTSKKKKKKDVDKKRKNLIEDTEKLMLNIKTLKMQLRKNTKTKEEKYGEVKDGMTCTEEEINEFCKELPRYKRPRKIIFEHVPRNATGKIEKPLLRRMHKSENLVAAENNA